MMWKLSRIFITVLLCISFMWMILFENKITRANDWVSDGILVTVKSSPESKFSSTLHIDDRKFFRSIVRSQTIKTDRKPELPEVYLTVKNGNQQMEYIVDHSLRVFLKNDNQLLQCSSDTTNKLLHSIHMVKRKHYGEAIPWTSVKEIFPRMGFAQVIDLETGLNFTVQRRAGNYHADVQPVTQDDTRIMKEIYNGKWSWKRRAILVKVKDKVIAASMNGMPHGAGAIKGNNFPGHFCIHFEGSTTHRLRKHDLSHNLMIRKASGQLNDVITKATPRELVNLVLTALKEKDLNIVKLTLDQSDPDAVEDFLEKAKGIENIRLMKADTSEENEKYSKESADRVEIPVHVSVFMSSQKKFQKKLQFVVTRDHEMNRWKIDVESLNLLF
ncbi:hypothetical protein [Collibacillus ludicampi]|nr:hypothetical protein [Collibacillus ludicampi]